MAEKIDYRRERLDDEAYKAEQKPHPLPADQRLIRIMAQMAVEERMIRDDS